MDINFRPNLARSSQDLLNQRVVINATAKLGTIVNVLPDADGNPYSLHVKVDGEPADAPPTVLAREEVALVPLSFTGTLDVGQSGHSAN